jgi:CheY-like chemotaxis protein
MTANAFPEDRARSLECGMSDFLSKPVDRAALSAMIVKWLRPVKEPAAAAG